MVCPHSTIRMKVFPESAVEPTRRRFPAQGVPLARAARPRLTIQVAPDDCTGCGVCVDVCPAKSKTEVRHKAINMEPVAEHRDVERERWDFFLSIPPLDEARLPTTRSRAARCSSRCSSSPGPAAAAARRPTSSWSPSSSATG
jgi:pyruvate-ferredoxin/flavodoxin oxidoreductase